MMTGRNLDRRLDGQAQTPVAAPAVPPNCALRVGPHRGRRYPRLPVGPSFPVRRQKYCGHLETEMSDKRAAHLMSGLTRPCSRVRAVCSCGFASTPHGGDDRVLAALAAERELITPVNPLCRYDCTGRSWQQLRKTDLQIFTDSPTGELLACRDMRHSFRDGYAQVQAGLIRAAQDGFGIAHPSPVPHTMPGGHL